MVPDEEIAAVLRYQSGETVCGRLIALANGAGGADNITVAVAE